MTQPSASDIVDPVLVETFRRDGFVHLKGLVDPAEIAVYRQAVDEAVASRKRNDTRALDEKSPYEQSFLQCQYIWEDFPGVRPLTFHPRVVGAAAALIGAEAVRLWHDQALYKEAGGRETEAHQDHPYWPIAEHDTLTAWIPLVPVDDQTGCMGYAPGSHRGEVHYVNIFSEPGAGKALEAQLKAPPVFVHAAPGDVLFHHGFTLHMAKSNPSDQTRRAYTAIYFRDGCTRAGERSHPSVDRDHIGVGEAIDGRATPIAWPLPGGRFPKPGPWPQPKSGSLLDRATRMGVFPQTPAG